MALDLLGNWTPGIGDPTIAGWSTVAAYFGASAVCARAAWRGGQPRYFWIALGLGMALLGVNKQLDFQSLLTDIARRAAHAGNWFEERRTIQAIFIAAMGVAGLLGAALILRYARGVPRPARAAAIGAVVLIAFIVIRAASFHHIERVLNSDVFAFRWNVVLELSGIAIIVIAALAAVGRVPTGRLVFSGLTLVAAAVSTIWLVSESALRNTYVPVPDTGRAAGSEAIAEGRRLAKLYGCTSCHGADYRGLRYNDDPMLVRHHAPNLTLLASGYSDQQFAQAIRQGIRPIDGRALWGMPSQTFVTMTDAEMGAILADLRSRRPGGTTTPSEGVGFMARVAIVSGLLIPIWRPLSDEIRKETQQPAPFLVARARANPAKDAGPDFAKGRHLAMTICGECHGSDLTGDAVEGGPSLDIVRSYQPEDFRKLLRSGKPPGDRDLGIMSKTAREDLRVLTDDEFAALYAYLNERVMNP